MRLWAYGTSPHGLDLSSEDFWLLSLKEFYALQDVQQHNTRMWAAQQALMVNMNLSADAEPFTANDFLGLGNRAKRVIDRQRSQAEATAANRKLRLMKPRKKDEPEPEWLPDWAREG